METVTVSVKVETDVPRPVAEHIAAEFLEWLDRLGYTIVPKHQTPSDERDFTELARDFIEEWV